tara:strand:+ start:145 stop:636 length:492 start_codon:yes stop_codon:yes gene_type:complete
MNAEITKNYNVEKELERLGYDSGRLIDKLVFEVTNLGMEYYQHNEFYRQGFVGGKGMTAEEILDECKEYEIDLDEYKDETVELDKKINEIENRLFGKKLSINILNNPYICDDYYHGYNDVLLECLSKGETTEALQDFLYEVRSSVESHEDHRDLLEEIEVHTY